MPVQIRPQEGHAVQMIRIETQAHPEQVQMIRHQTIHRADQALARRRMEHQFPELTVKRWREPAFGAVENGQRPVNHRIALVIFTRQTREIKRPIQRIAQRFVGGGHVPIL